jgi:hypothetical protein
MDDPVRVASIGDHPGELVGNAQPMLRLSQQHNAAVGGDPSTVEGGAYLLGRDRWQVKR